MHKAEEVCNWNNVLWLQANLEVEATRLGSLRKCIYIYIYGLRGANLRAVIDAIEQEGYVVVVLHMQQEKHPGGRALRKRVWFLTCLWPSATREQRASWQARANDIFNVLTASKTVQDEANAQNVCQWDRDVFRDKNDPEYVLFSSRDYMPQRARISLEDARKKDCQKKYVPKHACIWEAIREHGGGCLPSSLTIAPELMHFYHERRASLREMEILTLDKVLFGGSVAQQPGRRPLILDVSQSAHRIPRQVGFSPWVTPSSRLAVFDIDEAGSIKYAGGDFFLAQRSFRCKATARACWRSRT